MVTRSLSRGGIELGNLVKTLFAEGQTDYGLEPIALNDSQGHPMGRIEDGDGVIFCCRRGEREIQLTEAFTDLSFDKFDRPFMKDLKFVILTLYHEKFKDISVAFAPSKIQSTLGEMVSKAGLTQFRTSESEKFAHITFFLNGGNNIPFKGEEDMRIPSPKGVPFDQVPGLSLDQVTQQLTAGIKKNYDLIVTNFANGDVIGHTANNDAKIQCAAIVDQNLGKVVKEAIDADYVVLITADHGNLEVMTTEEGTPHVSHTTNLVNCILIDPKSKGIIGMRDGKLADVSPTILAALGVTQPAEMTGTSIVPDHDWQGKRKVILIILDGWGIGKNDDSNPIFLAKTPVWDGLLVNYPHCDLQASGEAVGLVAGKAGNSEAGHMNIGAGRVVPQDDVRLDQAMKDGSFFKNEIFCQTIDEVKRKKKKLHLIALLTEKSSHGSIDYPLAILKMAKEADLEEVYVHVIFDGRSTEPGSAPALLEKLDQKMDEIGLGTIVSGIGRGIALDRDGNYGKTKKAYDLLVTGTARTTSIA